MVELEVGSIYPICPIWTAPTAELSAPCGRIGPLRATSSTSTTSAYAAVAGGTPKRTNAEVRVTVAARHEDRIVANARQPQRYGRVSRTWKQVALRIIAFEALRRGCATFDWRARSNSATSSRFEGCKSLPISFSEALGRLIRAPWSPCAGDLSRSTGDLLRPRRWGSRSAAACADS